MGDYEKTVISLTMTSKMFANKMRSMIQKYEI